MYSSAVSFRGFRFRVQGLGISVWGFGVGALSLSLFSRKGGRVGFKSGLPWGLFLF